MGSSARRDGLLVTDGTVDADLDSVVALAEFRAALRRFFRQSERAARRSGLTPQRYLLVLMIKGAPDRSEECTVSSLMHRLQLAQSTVTEAVARAEEAGLVARRTADDDARVVVLRLTEEGERRLMDCFTALEAERRLLADAMTDLES